MRPASAGLLLVSSLVLVFATACGEEDGGVVHVAKEPSCNPLGPGDACAMPFPSAIFEAVDDATESGMRVSIPDGALPANRDGIRIDPAPFNRADGFSPATSIVVHLGVEPSADGLPGWSDLSASLADDSPTVVVDLESGERVAHFAEVDQNEIRPEDRVLLIRPATRLLPARRYAVGLRRSLVDVSGAPLPGSAAFEAVLSGEETDSELLEAHRAELVAAVDGLVAAGVPRDDLLLAWDFTTASDEFLTGTLLSMRAQALQALGESGIGFTIDEVEIDVAEHLAVRIQGTFMSPMVLTEQGGEDGVLARDADGLPVLQGLEPRHFTITIPDSARGAGEPRPLVIFGHGLLGDPSGEMSGSAFRTISQELAMPAAGLYWSGLSEPDEVAVVRALVDWNEFALVSDKLQQAIIDAIALTRTVRGQIRLDPALAFDGVPAIADDEVYYYGASLGGTMGASFMSYTTDVERGALNVPGGIWSLMIHRSADWPDQRRVFQNGYEREIDRQLIVVMSQAQWDFADPITTCPHLTDDPLPDTPAHRVVLQESVADAEVTNLATENMARTIGLPLLAPSVREVWGLDPEDGPLDSALSVWDTGDPIDNPVGNVPAPDNEAHGAIRRLPALIEQLRRFFRPDGRVEHTCDGPCDPE
ncbi:MAG: hypothetical protein HY996_06040 [Micrococcales bacterium]|nr:hypothetical protein [Micrococcales bacterium]